MTGYAVLKRKGKAAGTDLDRERFLECFARSTGRGADIEPAQQGTPIGRHVERTLPDLARITFIEIKRDLILARGESGHHLKAGPRIPHAEVQTQIAWITGQSEIRKRIEAPSPADRAVR